MFKNWIFLLPALVSEGVATFSHYWPSAVVVVGYGIAFYCLALTLRVIPTRGVVRAIGSGRALRRLGLPLLLLALLALCAAPVTRAAGPGPTAPTAAPDAALASKRSEESRMWMTIGERRFAITLTDAPTTRAFAAQLPLTLEMAELNENEKHAELAKALPTKASQPGKVRAGDLMLYGSSTLVVFYSTFDTTYSYTHLGHVDDPAGLAQALGRRGIRVVFSKNQ